MPYCKKGERRNTGRTHFKKGNHYSVATEFKPGNVRSKEIIAKAIEASTGEKSVVWKGEKACYETKHQWIRLHYGKANKCENPNCFYPRKGSGRRWIKCPKRYEWALIHGKEHNHKRENYIQLCPSCHHKYDLNLIEL